MNNLDYQRELLAFAEKIALAKLEESKASERVRELEYQKERFNLDVFIENIRQQEKKAKESTAVNTAKVGQDAGGSQKS